jgi:hypothetical protein
LPDPVPTDLIYFGRLGQQGLAKNWTIALCLSLSIITMQKMQQQHKLEEGLKGKLCK